MVLPKVLYQSNHSALTTVLDKSKRTLVRVSTVFPFDFFPDTVIVDEEKVNLVNRVFFFSQLVSGILIRDISNVIVTSDLIFASMQIQMSPFEINPGPVRYLWKKDAYLLRRVIMGLMVCEKEKVDISKLSDTELLRQVCEIGRSRAG